MRAIFNIAALNRAGFNRNYISGSGAKPTVIGISPGQTRHASASAKPAATFSIPMSSATISLYNNTTSSAVSGTSAYNSTTNAVTFTPSTALTKNDRYTATVNGIATDISSLPTYTWSFTVGTRKPTWFHGLGRHRVGAR